MQVDIERLWAYHTEGKLRHSVHPTRDLHVWCYSQSTVYNRDWDDLTRMCRGLVTTGDGTVVCRPFPKFFNWGEPGVSGDLMRPFIAYDKMDGSLIIVGVDADGQRVVSTKGSFTTWHSERAAEMLGTWQPPEGWTVVFEFIDPGNRIVVDYGDLSGLILLGGVHIETGDDHFTPDDVAEFTGWFGEVVVSRNFHLHNMINTVKDPAMGENREGFVLVYPNYEGGPSERVKIKFASYVLLHHTLSRISNVGVWEALKIGQFDELLDLVPDEMYDKVRETADELIGRHMHYMDGVNDDAREAASLHDNRKDQAEWVIAHAIDRALTFRALDQKLTDEHVWDAIKPERDATWSFLK